MDQLPDDKRQFINAFLQRPLIARMATAGCDGQPHVVPVWYGWDGESIWISAYADTRKVKELEENPLIGIAIDEALDGDHASAVILEGRAELLREQSEFLRQQFTWIYARYLGDEGVKAARIQDWIHDPINTLIKLTPSKIYSWNW